MATKMTPKELKVIKLRKINFRAKSNMAAGCRACIRVGIQRVKPCSLSLYKSISSTAVDSSQVMLQRGKSKQPSKKSLDTKEELLTTCIQVIQETIQSKAETQPQSPFALYISQKLSDTRSRAITENMICDIIELNSQSLNAQPGYHIDQGEPVQYMTLLQSGKDPYGRLRQQLYIRVNSN